MARRAKRSVLSLQRQREKERIRALQREAAEQLDRAKPKPNRFAVLRNVVR